MVSVIIPVYNGAQYIKTCMDALLGTPVACELEVIAVSDGSTDDSVALLTAYQQTYPNLHVIDKKENEGQAKTRHIGIEAAKGDFIAFLDIDDYVDPQMYVLLEEKAKASGADIVFCDYVEEFPSRSVSKTSRFHKGQTFPMRGTEALRYLHRRMAVFPYPWNKLYRTELFRDTVPSPIGGFIGEDYYVLLRLFAKDILVDYVAFPGYHYMQTENSISRSGFGEKSVRTYHYYQEDLAFVERNLPAHRKEIANYLIVEFMAIIISMGRGRTYDRRMIREIKAFVRKHLFGFLGARYVPLKMKCSAIALSISYRLLILAYRLLSR